MAFQTSLGPITVELDFKRAPASVSNIVRLVEEGHYDGLIFHRVMPGFVIQTGGFTPDLTKRESSKTIVNEAHNGLSNVEGTLGMARTADPDSASSQFYINSKDNIMLDRGPSSVGYTVFGRVIEGMETVRTIEQVPTHSVNGMDDVPVEPVTIISAKLIPKSPTKSNGP